MLVSMNDLEHLVTDHAFALDVFIPSKSVTSDVRCRSSSNGEHKVWLCFL